MKKIKLFTHADLDGYGCKFLMDLLPDTCVDTVAIDGSIESIEQIKDYLLNKEYTNYDITFITDLVVNKETIKAINNSENLNIKFLDHHRSSLWMNKYSWATIKVDGEEEPTCGTELLFEYLKDDLKCIKSSNYSLYKNITKMVQEIKRYDTWLWFSKYKDAKSKQLNDLLYILGWEKFGEGILKHKYSVDKILKEHEILLELEQQKIEEYIERKNREIIIKQIDDYIVGIVFAEQYQSELGNRLASLNENCDIIMMIGDLFIKCRTVKENVDCAEFAKKFGGGGQTKASGGLISKDIKDNIINIILG